MTGWKRTCALAATMAVALFAAEGGGAAGPDARTAWDFKFSSIDGGTLDLAAYKGKVLLVVNTASFCGFTPQYKGLQALSDKYEAKGLVVIGVPANDFGEQEPGSESEIKSFCEGAFGITFPLAGKTVVKGAQAHGFYQWAAAVLGSQNAPRWNFHKYLVGADGRLVTAFSTSIEPGDPRVTQAVERELAKRPGS